MSEYVLELKGITKIFPGVKALNNVQFQLKPGEVHALMGENGAGKSTFIKVITGVRRSGKSKLLEAFKDYIQKTDANANLIHVNFNLLEFQSLTTYEKLNSYVESKFVEGKNNFVLID